MHRPSALFLALLRGSHRVVRVAPYRRRPEPRRDRRRGQHPDRRGRHDRRSRADARVGLLRRRARYATRPLPRRHDRRLGAPCESGASGPGGRRRPPAGQPADLCSRPRRLGRAASGHRRDERHAVRRGGGREPRVQLRAPHPHAGSRTGELPLPRRQRLSPRRVARLPRIAHRDARRNPHRHRRRDEPGGDDLGPRQPLRSHPDPRYRHRGRSRGARDTRQGRRRGRRDPLRPWGALELRHGGDGIPSENVGARVAREVPGVNLDRHRPLASRNRRHGDQRRHDRPAAELGDLGCPRHALDGAARRRLARDRDARRVGARGGTRRRSRRSSPRHSARTTRRCAG